MANADNTAVDQEFKNLVEQLIQQPPVSRDLLFSIQQGGFLKQEDTEEEK